MATVWEEGDFDSGRDASAEEYAPYFPDEIEEDDEDDAGYIWGWADDGGYQEVKRSLR